MELDLQIYTPQTFKTVRVVGSKYPHEYLSIGHLNRKQFDEVLRLQREAQELTYKKAIQDNPKTLG